MMTPAAVLEYVEAEPFRPFRTRMQGGQTIDAIHPEVLKVGRREVLVVPFDDDQRDLFERRHHVSLELMESIGHLGSLAAS